MESLRVTMTNHSLPTILSPSELSHWLPNTTAENVTPDSIFDSWWEKLSSEVAISYYWHTGIIVWLLFFMLPFLGPILYAMIMYGGLIIVVKYNMFQQKRRKGYKCVDLDEVRELAIWWVTLVGDVCFAHDVYLTEKLPEEPTIYLAYHGNFAADIPLALSKGFGLVTKRCYVSVDKNHSKAMNNADENGAIGTLLKVYGIGGWDREELIRIMKDGHHIIFMPGGSLELQMSDHNYRIHWGDRKGFARIAVETKAPIVPVFCRNIQEAFRTPWFLRPFVRGRFKIKKFVAAWGGLPVKLTSIFGPVIPYDENLTVDEVAAKTKGIFQRFIDEHQQPPGNQWRALKERFSGKPYWQMVEERERQKKQLEANDFADSTETHKLLVEGSDFII